MPQLVDNNKTGTLILGYYRNGTHFLQDVIADQNAGFEIFGEIGNDNTIADFERLNTVKAYKVCILNNTAPKFHLVGSPGYLDHWHVVHLTRKDKVHHFISYWFWEQNTANQRMNNSGLFRHHNTDRASYQSVLNQPRRHCDIDAVIAWLQEQLINYHLPFDTEIDYGELPQLATDNIAWQPNNYDSISLSDIFENHKEISELLSNYRL